MRLKLSTLFLLLLSTALIGCVTVVMPAPSDAIDSLASDRVEDDPYSGRDIRYDDIEDSEAVSEYRALSKWGKTDLTYTFLNGTDHFSGTEEWDIVRVAFDAWADVTPLTFTEVEGDSADITIGWTTRSSDGPGDVLAFATYPNPFTNRSVILRFDDAERWVNSTRANVDLYTVAVHEIGHALGLGHSDDVDSIMFASYLGPRRSLGSDDIAGIQRLYGESTDAPVVDDNPLPETPSETAGQPVSQQLVRQVQRYLINALRTEINAFYNGDASQLDRVFAGDVLANAEQQIVNNNANGIGSYNELDASNSYIDDIRHLNDSLLEVDTCETWQTSTFDRSTQETVGDTSTRLLPQTLTIEQLGNGWFITNVQFYDAPAFCG